jgi:hypothetical protein
MLPAFQKPELRGRSAGPDVNQQFSNPAPLTDPSRSVSTGESMKNFTPSLVVLMCVLFAGTSYAQVAPEQARNFQIKKLAAD